MTTPITPDKKHVLQAIDLVIDQCNASQHKEPDEAVRLEILGLQNVRKIVEQEWPLTDENKAKLNIGVVAVKNISDWNKELTTSLTTIDYVLRNDGLMIERILGSSTS